MGGDACRMDRDYRRQANQHLPRSRWCRLSSGPGGTTGQTECQTVPGRSARQCADLANKSDPDGSKIRRLSANTIKDKVGCVRRFFDWAKSHDATVVNPVDAIKIERPKKRNRVKPRSTWSIDELNRMFETPIYTGCRSPSRWKERGNFCMQDTAEYWVPLIGLFSGLRLGEIVQMHVADIREVSGVYYFAVTTDAADSSADEDRKSVKTAAGHRNVPIHQTLIDYGLLELIRRRRNAGLVRLFPEYQRSRDDDSWSKAFSKHFARFRKTFEVRADVHFHSLRHNFEDALRNEARRIGGCSRCYHRARRKWRRRPAVWRRLYGRDHERVRASGGLSGAETTIEMMRLRQFRNERILSLLLAVEAHTQASYPKGPPYIGDNSRFYRRNARTPSHFLRPRRARKVTSATARNADMGPSTRWARLDRSNYACAKAALPLAAELMRLFDC